MSGGAFAYQSHVIEHFAEDVDMIIRGEIDDSNEYKGPHITGCGYYDGDGAFYRDASPDGKTLIEAFALVIHMAGVAAHALEWWASGDWGEETTMLRASEELWKYAPALDKAIAAMSPAKKETVPDGEPRT